MLHQLPLYVSLVFGVTTLATVWLFYRASRQSALVLVVLLAWMALQAGLSLAGFYRQTDAMPPRFPALVIPPLLVLIGLLRTAGGGRFLDSLRLDQLTLLHTIRIPVELVLFWLFVAGAVPKEMTFEGRNVDILSGLTAPVVHYLAFVRKRLSGRGLLIWNLICLGLLVNIVLTAAMAVPSPVQQIAFSQPNIAILYFPFVWLPSVVVPIVLVAHVSALRQLRRKASEKQTDLFIH